MANTERSVETQKELYYVSVLAVEHGYPIFAQIVVLKKLNLLLLLLSNFQQ